MYANDLLETLDPTELKTVQKGIEADGWDIISWGVDAHDTLEYTVHRREDDGHRFLSLYLLPNAEDSTFYTLEMLTETDFGSQKTQLTSGNSKSFTARDLENLFKRGQSVGANNSRVLSPLFAAIGATDVALERMGEVVAVLRAQAETAVNPPATGIALRPIDLTEMVGISELRNIVTQRAAAVEAYQDLVKRGQAALARIRLAIDEAGDDPDAQRRRVEQAPWAAEIRQAPVKVSKRVTVKKAPAKKVVAKKAAARKKAPAKVAKHSPR